MAGKVVNQLMELMKEKHLQTFSGNSTAFLEQQFNNYANQLKQSESRWETFKQKNGVFSIDEQRSAILAQRMAFEADFADDPNPDCGIGTSVVLMKGGKSNIELTQEARSRLMVLHEKEQGLLMKYNENSRPCKTSERRCKPCKRQLLEFSESTKEGFHQSWNLNFRR